MTTNQVNQKKAKPVQHRRFEGVVVSKGNKTISVQVKSVKYHAKYKKQFFTHKKFAVHDEAGKAEIGAKVSFVECRPLSKTKRWRLVKILQ